MKDLVTIVIPVFKTHLTANELRSLSQCCRVLFNHPITLVAPDDLEVGEYEAEFLSFGCNYKVLRFRNDYFRNIAGYNRLLLSQVFYTEFQSYMYMLLYQLDAFVFSDELAYWCGKGYDYIGAPLIGKYEDTIFSNQMRVGNGGFSLRRVDAFMNYFDSKKNVFTARQIVKKYGLRNKLYKWWLVWILMYCGWRNKPQSVANRWKYNEDDFWSGLLDRSRFSLNKPTPIEAMEFSFERFPKEIYELTGKLPFGCHAWEKYDYDIFWKKYIPGLSTINYH